MKELIKIHVVFFAFMFILSACGGGSSNNSSITNQQNPTISEPIINIQGQVDPKLLHGNISTSLFSISTPFVCQYRLMDQSGKSLAKDSVLVEVPNFGGNFTVAQVKSIDPSTVALTTVVCNRSDTAASTSSLRQDLVLTTEPSIVTLGGFTFELSVTCNDGTSDCTEDQASVNIVVTEEGAAVASTMVSVATVGEFQGAPGLCPIIVVGLEACDNFKLLNDNEFIAGIQFVVCTGLGIGFDTFCTEGGTASCGNGTVDQGEACDPKFVCNAEKCPIYCNGNLCNSDCTCSPSPPPPPPNNCGNGIIDSGEECDNSFVCPPGERCRIICNGGPCSEKCTCINTVNCGNGIVDHGEYCDPSVPSSCPAGTCTSTCDSCCADGQLGGLEVCDGDPINQCPGLTNPSCGFECKSCLGCGDGICMGSNCDDGFCGEDCSTCPQDCGECDKEHCGDGACNANETPCTDKTCPQTQEGTTRCPDDCGLLTCSCNQNGFCEFGENTSCCLSDCHCGDGAVEDKWEACDESAASNGCDPNNTCIDCSICIFHLCGNGIVEFGESCDGDQSLGCEGGCNQADCTCIPVKPAAVPK